MVISIIKLLSPLREPLDYQNFKQIASQTIPTRKIDSTKNWDYMPEIMTERNCIIVYNQCAPGKT